MKFNNAVCCIIKNEPYLEEFILYYHLIGVEHFYIYDNESKPPIQKRLKQDLFKEICTIIPFPGLVQQMKAYNHCIQLTKNIVNWLIIIDGDEFIHLKKHKCMNDFLQNYKDYHAVGLNWIMFGSSFHEKKQKGLLIDNYIYCMGKQFNLIKTICKPRFVRTIGGPHHVNLIHPKLYVDTHKKQISGPFNENPNIDIAPINHYYGKSLDEMKQKINRGRADMTAKREMPINYHSFYNRKANKELKNKMGKKVMNKMKELNINF